MIRRVLEVILFSLVVSSLPSSFQSAIADEILWNPNVGNSLSEAEPGLVPGAALRGTNLLVLKSNPDELIMKIIMRESFEDKPFSGKGRNMAMWLFWPTNYCWSKDKANCEGLFTVGDPLNPLSYPTTKASEYVTIQKHNKASNVDVKPTNCKAPWWIENTFKPRDTWAFALSITCLGIPKVFGWYAFSEIDLGQKEIATDFTQVQTITYPFWDLASSAAAKNNNSTLSAQSKKQICVLATTGKGYDEEIDFEEQCSDSNSHWGFTYCDSHTRSDLEVFKNNKWKKVRTVKSTKGYCDDPNLSNSFTHKSPLAGKYRIKSYGNTKLTIAYLNLKIYRKDIA